MSRWFNAVVMLVVAFGLGTVDRRAASAQSLPQDVGYNQPAGFSELPRINFSPSAGDVSDTLRLIDVIEEASARRTTTSSGAVISGARVFFADGTYRLQNVPLQSNVHLRFGRDVTILLDTTSIPGLRGPCVFLMQGGATNVSIVGNARSRPVNIVGPPTPSDPRADTRFRAIVIQGARNFLLRNITIDNRRSRLSTIFLGGEGNSPAERADGPVPLMGSIININSINNNAGFGAIQMHAGGQVAFSNIRSVGGVTLRFESGIATTHGVQDVEARNIRIEDGRTAVLFQPHSVRSHNRIRVRNVVATNSGFGVEFLRGFVSSRDRELNRPEFLQRGEFQNLTVSRVTANFGDGDGAQIRPNSFRLLRPSDVGGFIPSFATFLAQRRSNGDTLTGPPLGAILNEAVGYTPSINEPSLRFNGFPADLQQPRISTRTTPDRNNESRRLRRAFRALGRML